MRAIVCRHFLLQKIGIADEARIVIVRVQIKAENPGRVTPKTRIGSSRNLDMLSGEQLPRIC